jgi:GDP-mannose 6-dehydrogenase
MRIAVFGLGYVGTVVGACLAEQGHLVTGVDPQAVKVDSLRSGHSPVIEAEVNQLLGAALSQGLLRASTNARDAVLSSEVGIVCVGTPSEFNGSLDLTFLRRVAADIGSAIADHSGYFTIVVRSTVLPGTTRDVVIPALERASGLKAGVDFGLCYNPEFLREGSAVADFRSPPKTVLGAIDDRSRSIVTPIVERPGAPTIQTTIEVAEMVKYADNAWHALKVAFANEIGTISKSSGVDGREVMDAFAADEKLNLSAAYLKPGFAFGGSCLPKDVRALAYRGTRLDLELPLINSILPSNRAHLDRAFDLITKSGHREIGILGLAFKAGTDDLRESPMVEIVERLIGKGYKLRIFDPSVNLAKLVGANRDFILHQIPHISSLMVDSLAEVLDTSQTIVLGTADPAFSDVLADVSPDQEIIDLVRLGKGLSSSDGYDGICW